MESVNLKVGQEVTINLHGTSVSFHISFRETRAVAEIDVDGERTQIAVFSFLPTRQDLPE